MPDKKSIRDNLQRIVSDGGNVQNIYGNYNAVAGEFGTAIVNVYQQASPFQLDSDEVEKARQKLDALPAESTPEFADLPGYSRVPFGRNPVFVGRQVDLRNIAAILKRGQSLVITGMGGIGKTQLTIEFVHRYGQFFHGGVFWLSFDNADAVPSEVAACGAGLALHPAFHTLPIAEQVRLVSIAWQTRPCLIVFDNCEDETLYARWKIPSGQSRIIVTSRRSSWNIALGLEVYALGVLGRSESIALLRKHRPDLTTYDADLNNIAAELGDLALALHLAGGFLARYKHVLTPSTYLLQLTSSGLLGHASLVGRGMKVSPTDHELHVARTFAISYERLDPADSVDHMAIEILTRVSCLAPGEQIPPAFVFQTMDLDDADFEVKLMAEDALARLVDLALIEDGQTISQHRLLGAYTQSVSGDIDGARKAVENALIVLFRISERSGNYSDVRALEIHLRAVTSRAIAVEDELAGRLCNTLGNYLRTYVNYHEARAYLEKALEIDQKVLGDDNPALAISLNDLGLALTRLELFEPAKSLLLRALSFFEKSNDLVNAAATLDNLGQLATSAMEHSDARKYLNRAIEIRERVLGATHPQLAISYQSLGNLLTIQEKFDEGRASYEKALTIRKRVFGSQSRNTAFSLASISFILEQQGKFDEALRYSEEATQITENTLGPDHPSTSSTLGTTVRLMALNGMAKNAELLLVRLRTYLRNMPIKPVDFIFLNNLGLTFWYCGDYREALTYYSRIPENATGINERVTLNNHALALAAFEKYDIARALYTKALQYERNAKRGSLLMAKILNNLGLLYRAAGQYAESQACLEEAIAIRTEKSGATHRDTVTSLSNLGLTLLCSKNTAGARKYISRAMEIRQALFMEYHPDMSQSYNDMGLVFYEEGNFGEAHACFEKALQTRERTLLEMHPLLGETLACLGKVCLAQGINDAAGAYFARSLAILKSRYGDDHSQTKSVLAGLASASS